MKVAIYCRLSEEDRNKKNEHDDSESIQNQKSMLINHAVQQGWEIFHIYSDDDYTGSDRSRPDFNNLLQDAEKRKFDIVLCKSQSRFTRELELVEKYIHDLFPIWGIRFISIVDNADTNIKGNKKARQINGLINEWYLEDLSENIKSVFLNKMHKGVHIGAFALYGYMKDPNQKGHLIVDDEAAKIVREVFNLFAQGYGKAAIARILNERGIPNPTEYKRRQGLRYNQPKTGNSTLWKYFAISDMLINEMYIGNMVQHKAESISYKSKIIKQNPKNQWIKVEGTHEPIIDKELWDKVQDLIRQKTRPCYSGKIGLFARKVKCVHCSYTMRSCIVRGKRYLKCSTKHIAKNACIGSFISIEKLEQVVLGELQKISSQICDNGELEKTVCFNDRLEESIEKITNDIATYKQRFNECTSAVKSLYTDKVKGLITDDEFIELSKEYHEDKSKLEMLIEEADEQLNLFEIKKHATSDKSKLIEQYASITKLEREHVDTLIDYINVGKRDRETNTYPVEIYWNF